MFMKAVILWKMDLDGRDANFKKMDEESRTTLKKLKEIHGFIVLVLLLVGLYILVTTIINLSDSDNHYPSDGTFWGDFISGAMTFLIAIAPLVLLFMIGTMISVAFKVLVYSKYEDESIKN